MAEAHNGGAGVPARKVAEVTRVGSVPAVDRLVRIADDTKIEAVAAPRFQHAVLRGIHVLEFVDEQTLESPTLGRREFGVALDSGGAQTQQIVEVDPTFLAFAFLVAAVEASVPHPRAVRPA